MSRCPHGLPDDTCALCDPAPTVTEMVIVLKRSTDTIQGSLEEYCRDRRVDPAVIADYRCILSSVER